MLFKGAEQYEAITRVPFIWSDPAGQAGIRTDEIGQTIDIGTTILERARIEAPEGMQGQSLSVVGGSGRRVAFIQYDHQRKNGAFGNAPRVHTVHDGRWRLSVFHGTEFAELYDLETDPDELFNLWAREDHALVRCRMLQKLAEAEIASIDRVPLPTGAA